MEHPLISNIDNLNVEDLLAKVTELNKKLSIAWRLGNHDLCNQLRMAIETYQNKYMQKLRDSHNNTDNDGIIDIT
jgi:hypothetical protein